MFILTFHSTHDLHQLKKAQLPLWGNPAMDAKSVITLVNMSFRASASRHAVRALFFYPPPASRHFVPRLAGVAPAVDPRRPSVQIATHQKSERRKI